MTNPLVSVIVPSKNSEEFIDRCLKSIKNQTYRNIEIIVVDNDSLDKTRDIVKKYRATVFNHGPERSAQRNYGALKSKGKFVYFVDSDFVLNKNVVKECMLEISKGYDAVVVHNTPDENVSWIAKIRKFEVDMYKYSLDHSAARFFNKKVFNNIGGYDQTITAGEDYDIQNKLNRNGYKTGFVEAEAIHLGEPKSFWKHMKKYYYYGKDFINYKEINAKESAGQLSFIREEYKKNWKKFLYNPILGLGFLLYNLSKFSFGGIGYISARLNR